MHSLMVSHFDNLAWQLLSRLTMLWLNQECFAVCLFHNIKPGLTKNGLLLHGKLDKYGFWVLGPPHMLYIKRANIQQNSCQLVQLVLVCVNFLIPVQTHLQKSTFLWLYAYRELSFRVTHFAQGQDFYTWFVVALYMQSSLRWCPFSSSLTSELNATTPTFTLTCTSTGGPATIVSWTVNNRTVTEDENHHITSQILTDPEEATYNHILAVTGRLEGQYECRVSNTKSSDRKELGVVGK